MSKEEKQKKMLEFAKLVRSEREKRGWSQEKLGQEAGVATNTVFSVEHASPTVPRTRAKVAVALEIDYVW